MVCEARVKPINFRIASEESLNSVHRKNLKANLKLMMW